jgi:hypothetical protein
LAATQFSGPNDTSEEGVSSFTANDNDAAVSLETKYTGGANVTMKGVNVNDDEEDEGSVIKEQSLDTP